jgi:hypothetical protein
MGWEGTDTEDVYSPERVDSFPFTAQGRQFERCERELALASAVLKVGALVLERQSKRRAMPSRKRASPTVYSLP